MREESERHCLPGRKLIYSDEDYQKVMQKMLRMRSLSSYPGRVVSCHPLLPHVGVTGDDDLVDYEARTPTRTLDMTRKRTCEHL
ncbi:hypothetical protein JHK86_011940 [Glycine max]|nr:hypothetical protein JHK86_011940 [Glycine max]